MAFPPRRGAELWLLAASLVLSIPIAELVVRLVAPQTLPSQEEVRGYVIEGMYVADPRAGYRPAPRFSGRLERRRLVTEFSTNALGLRGDEVGPKTRPRVLALGDSMTWGWGVRQGDEWVHWVGREVTRLGGPEVECLNGGVNGYGTANELALLEELGPAVSPDLVLLGFFPNDYADNLLGATGAFTVRDGYLFDLASEQWFREHWLTRHSHLWRLGQVARETWRVRYAGGVPGARPGRLLNAQEIRRGMDLSSEYIRRTAGVARSLGARLAVVWLPPMTHARARLRPEDIPLQRELQRRVEDAGIASFDALPRLAAEPDSAALYIPGDGHLSAAGHRLVGSAVGAWAVEAGLLPTRAR